MSETGATLLRGGGFRLLALFGGLVLQIALLPYTLHHLGEHDYGLWVVVGTATGSYAFLDLGVSSAVTRFVSRELGRSGPGAAAPYLRAARRVFRRSAWAVLALSAMVATVGYLVMDVPTDARIFALTVLVSGLGIAATFPAKVEQGILVAEMRHDLAAGVGLTGNLVRGAATFLVLGLGGKLIALATANALVAALQSVAVIALCRRYCQKYPEADAGGPEVKTEMYSYAGYTMLGKVADFLRFRVHPLTISAFLKFADVAPFAVHDRVQRIAVDACESVLSMLTPLFSRHEGRGDRAAVQRIYLLSYKISCYVGGYTLGLVTLLAPIFIPVWLGKPNELVVQLLYLRFAGSLCGIIQMPSVNLLSGSSENRIYAYTNGIHALLTFGSTVLLVHSGGLAGIVLGMSMATVLIKTFVQAPVACRVAGVPFASFHFRHTLMNLSRVAVYLAPIAWIVHHGYPARFWPLLALAGGATLAFPPYLYWVGFRPEERRLFLESGRKLWRKVRPAPSAPPPAS